MLTMEEKNTERYLSTGELMQMLSVSRSTVYRLMAKGMPNLMVGSVHRFPMNQVVGWLEHQTGNKLTNRETPNAAID
jgi:excisionase family DNA binding protein